MTRGVIASDRPACLTSAIIYATTRAQRILMDEHGEEAQRLVAVIGKVIQGKHETASGGVR